MAAVKKASPLPHQEDYASQRVADTVKENARPGDAGVFDGAKLHSVVITGAVSKDLIHKLGKKPTGFFVADTDQFVLVRRVSSDATIIRLDYSGPCNAKVVVF